MYIKNVEGPLPNTGDQSTASPIRGDRVSGAVAKSNLDLIERAGSVENSA